MADSPRNPFASRVAPTSSPALVVNRPGERVPYEAFGTKDKVIRLDVRCADGVAHAVPYHYLVNVSYNRKSYAEVFLTVSGLTIMIKGKGLRPIVDALKQHSCEFIQEFDGEAFLTPGDINAPLVESIHVEVMRGAAPEKAEGEKSA